MSHAAIMQRIMREVSEEERRVARTPREPIPNPAFDRRLARARAAVAQAQFLARRDNDYARAAEAFEHARWLRQVQSDPLHRAVLQGAVAYAVRTVGGWS